MKLFGPLALLAAFSSACTADEKAPAPLTATGHIAVLVAQDEQGTHINGDTFRLVTQDKAGKEVVYPLDLQQKDELAFFLYRLRNREITLEGTLVEKEWYRVISVPLFSELKITLPEVMPVLRVAEVRVNFDKDPLDKPQKDD